MKKSEREKRRLQRLMARLALLNEMPPQPDWSAHRRKIWLQQRETILRQLQRRGVGETENPVPS